MLAMITQEYPFSNATKCALNTPRRKLPWAVIRASIFIALRSPLLAKLILLTALALFSAFDRFVAA